MPQTQGAKRSAPGQRRSGRKKAEPREPLSRERIIAAAVELLDERGLEGFTMRALGERLGVEAMAIYHYFPNKQMLLEVLGTGVDLAAFFGEFVGLPMAGRSAADLVVELGMRYLQFAHENPAQFTLLFSVLPINYVSWEDFVNGTSTFQLPQKAVQKGIETGEFIARPGFGANEMSYALWALVHGLAMLRHTRLRALEADFDTLHRTLLAELVGIFKEG
jgi:AcrR family transcriptional regulator